jgi:hypothetical protein
LGGRDRAQRGLGLLTIGVLAASWLISTPVYRRKRYDEIEATGRLVEER